ncbi:uncharacterized protein SPSK_04459 [Sporothrix schenckii 1099-18]|nr:uncharacterized protein SPSK_04459 [Sporothrix schenckii 1099-18]KJR82823.1 hypothetical protein SPSK_04459 [Sporothrix schenckii 1099-18]
MVLLTMTPSIVEGLKRLGANANSADSAQGTFLVEEGEPDLSSPAVAKPISHAQILRLAAALDALHAPEPATTVTTLETLLVGARVHVPPPPPKPEPSAEYKALMARLRRDEQARAYERMVNPPDAYDTSTFAQVHRPVYAADTGDDGVTLSDVNRQVMLIFNFVLTMAGVAYALWMLARWWPTPSRLFLAMGGSMATGLVEYGLYAGYVWHLADAARREKNAPKEVREVVNTWAVGPGGKDNTDSPQTEKETTRTHDTTSHQDVLLPGSKGATGIDSKQARRRKQDTAPAS